MIEIPKRKFLWVAVLFGAVATFSGCGGNDDDPAPSAPVTQSGSVRGSATKGTVRNAVVEMKQFGANGQLINSPLLGSGSTDDNGNYLVNYSGYSGGPVQLCVRTRRASDNPPTPATTVVCDSTDGPACGPAPVGGASVGDADNDQIYDLGESIPAPSDFEFCTCLPEPPANGIRAPITPFTDLVVRRAAQRDADAALNETLAQALLRAASEINQLAAGLDVLRLEAIDLSNPAARNAATPDQLVYSALLAAVLGQGVDGTGSNPVNLTTLIQDLRNQGGDGTFTFAAIEGLIAEAQEQLLIAGGDESGRLAALQDQVDQAQASNPSGEFDTAPSTSSNDSGITRAKNLVRNVRTTISGLRELEQPGQVFQSQSDLAFSVLDPINGPIDDLFQDMGFALQAADTFLSAQTDVNGNTADGTTTLDSADGNVSDNGTNQTATVTITGGSGGPKVVTINGVVKDLAINNLRLTFTNNPDFTTANPLTASLAGGAETTGTGTGLNLAIGANSSFTLTKTGNVALDNGQTDDALRISTIALNLSATLAQVRAGQQQGGPVSFTGAVGGTVVRCTAQSCVNRESGQNARGTLTPSAFNLSGSFSNTANSVAMSVVATVANAASFDPELNSNTNNDTITPTNFPQGTVTLTFDADLGDVAPARAVLTGTLNGIFAQPETDCGPSPCPQGTTHNDPNATVSLTLLRSNVQVFRLQATTRDAGDNTAVDATITDSANAVITIIDDNNEQNDVIGEVRVDGVRVGEVRRLSTGLVVVRYDDGSFESLFN